LRRLFSSFARGWPGLGLLIMRLVGAMCLIAYEVAMPRTGSHFYVVLARAGPLVLALLIAAGLWTPIAGTLVATLGLSHALQSRDPLVSVLIATLGAALSLVGPGAWSVDARLFG
jgi:putative oxidoreductase